MNYITRATGWICCPEDQPLFSEMSTQVTIVDEAAGEFVEVRQHGRTDVGMITINVEEWPALRWTIDLAISGCKPEKPQP